MLNKLNLKKKKKTKNEKKLGIRVQKDFQSLEEIQLQHLKVGLGLLKWNKILSLTKESFK